MKSLKRLLCVWLILALSFSFCAVGTLSDKAEDKSSVDMEKQNGITAYALSFADNVDLQYVWGGYGGRAYSYNGESGENNGIWSLEQCIKYIDLWSTNPEDNKWKPYGTDCSGFVSAVFSHFGISTPSVVSGFTTGDYAEITKSEAEPGDVVCYWGYDSSEDAWGYCHIALYLGDGLIIHVNTRYGYSGRTTPYGGYMTPEKKTGPTYCHISKDDYWSSATAHYFRVVDNKSDYPITREQESVLSGKSLVVSECDLDGMPEDSPITQDMLNLMMPDRSGLSQLEKNNIVSIGNKLDSDAPFILKFINVALNVIGIALVLYAVLLVLGFTFDNVNSFVDISLIGIISFGNIKLISKDDYSELSDKDKKNYTTTTKFFVIVGVVVLFGILLISGILPKFIYKTILYIEGL